MMLLINVVSMVRRWLNWFSARVFCTSQNEKLATKIAQTMTAQNVEDALETVSLICLIFSFNKQVA